ncbi:MAG TPA: hypothetical protein VG944_22685 [Fimbriimonas sp.]|nr:hypothetical protein [Fimbriimonas sp.]
MVLLAEVVILVVRLNGMAAFCLLGGAVPVLYEWLFVRRPLRDVQRLKDSPEVAPQFSVMVELLQGDIPYGSDWGIVVFEGPWMIFRGLRTSFSLRSADVTVSSESWSPFFGAKQATVKAGTTLRFEAFERAHCISLKQLAGGHDIGGRRALWFDHHIREWAETVDHTQATAEYPPLTPSTQRLTEVKREFLGALAVIGFSSIALVGASLLVGFDKASSYGIYLAVVWGGLAIKPLLDWSRSRKYAATTRSSSAEERFSTDAIAEQAIPLGSDGLPPETGQRR